MRPAAWGGEGSRSPEALAGVARRHGESFWWAVGYVAAVEGDGVRPNPLGVSLSGRLDIWRGWRSQR